MKKKNTRTLDTLAKLQNFSMTALVAKWPKTVRFMFSNVAYRPTVDKTGTLTYYFLLHLDLKEESCPKSQSRPEWFFRRSCCSIFIFQSALYFILYIFFPFLGLIFSLSVELSRDKEQIKYLLNSIMIDIIIGIRLSLDDNE